MPSQASQAGDREGQAAEPNTNTIIGGESNTAGGTAKVAALVGGKIGKYEVRSQLGSGGMGAVFLAFDPLIEREVAIKVLSDDVNSASAAVQRFLQEARSIGRLNHPNVVSIFDIDQWNGQYYLVMELLSGGSLADVVDQSGPLPWSEACQMIAQAANGLAAAHAAGLVHRDIKPENLMRSKEGLVKVVDFGLSKLVDSAHDTRTSVTRQGQILGTPQYMSPEQFEAVELDLRTDIYSLGASLFRLLTARFPYQDCASIVQTMLAHLNKPVPQPTAWRAEIPADCDRIVARAMAKNRDDRYQTASELADDLTELVHGLRGLGTESGSDIPNRAEVGQARQQTSSFSRPATTAIDHSAPLKSVMIVEPSRMLATMLKDAMARAGASSVRVTATKQQAITEMMRQTPDLLVTSMQLPDGIGIEILDELASPSTATQTCLVLNSNDTTIEELVEARNAASRILAPKKVRPEDLLRLVHAVGPCMLQQGPVVAPIDPTAVRLVVITDSGKLYGGLPELIREIGLLDVTVLGLTDVSFIPKDEVATLIMCVREAGTKSGDDLSYARKPAWLGDSRHLLAEVQLDGSRLNLRAVHRLGVTGTTCRVFNLNTLTCLLQSCRST